VRLVTRFLVAALFSTVLPLGVDTLAAGASSVAKCSGPVATLSATSVDATYEPGSMVRVIVALRNRGSSACSFVTGPTSPNFLLTNAAGTTVWGSCWFGGGPAPCPFYLLQRVLAPGATYRDVLTWDQRSGHPDVRVRAGRYRFSVSLTGLSLRAATSFALATS